MRVARLLNFLDHTVLQSKSNDIADGIHMIELLIILVHETRKNVNQFHDKCYAQVLSLAAELDIDQKLPRHVKRQKNRENHPYSSPSEFFKCSVTIPLLDFLLIELNARFTEETLVTYTGLYLIPSKLVSIKAKGECCTVGSQADI